MTVLPARRRSEPDQAPIRTPFRPGSGSARPALFWALMAPLALMAGACTFNAGAPAALGGGGDAGTGPREDVGITAGGEVGTIMGTDGGFPEVAVCNHALAVVVRDFRGYVGPNAEPKHPDFEFATGDQKGIVAEMLGLDTKPVYAPAGTTRVTNGPDPFNQWYRDTPDVNERFEISITLTEDPARPGTYVYDNDAYFPLDGMGFGNQNQNHNFHFTSETHFTFPYRGGEVFTFRGDDDLWLFVNGHLAIDLGGVHVAETGRANLDQLAPMLGITPGNTYQMDIFHAERHTSQSTFHVETTLGCIESIVIP